MLPPAAGKGDEGPLRGSREMGVPAWGGVGDLGLQLCEASLFQMPSVSRKTRKSHEYAGLLSVMWVGQGDFAPAAGK